MAKKRKRKGPPFVKLDRTLLKGRAWRSLTRAERDAYEQLKCNFNGSNNGEISLRYSELEDLMSHATLSKALRGLEEKGWIERTMHGGRYRYYVLYRLTWQHDPM